jgi:peptidoglycan hydrolase-like protein with peptidoglycan-binding domain
MTLRLGANGAKVVALQKQLLKRGFNPGAVDGDFGPGTEAAVLAFQKSEGLLAEDYAGARRLVNGGRHGIERFTEAFVTGAALVPES